MILSDHDIKEELNHGSIKIIGGPELYIGPSSIDLHLSKFAKRLSRSVSYLDQHEDNSSKFDNVESEVFIINPGDFWIMSTVERLEFDNGQCGFIQGRSSVARLGVQVHAAGFFDPGFKGTATLEVTNMTDVPIHIYAGARICQMVFAKMATQSDVGYDEKSDSKYHQQNGPTVTRIHQE